MKLKKSFQNFCATLLILGIVTMPFLGLTKVARAQILGGSSSIVGSGATTSNSGNGSLSGFVRDLTPLIKQMPGCSDMLKSGVKDLWKGVKNLFSKAKGTQVGARLANSLGKKVEEKTGISNSVAIYDESGNTKLDRVIAKQDEQKTSLAAIETSTGSMNKNQQCLNSIGKAVVKSMINKLTLSIVDWINTGNAGGSFYVQDPSKFFKDIGKNQILSLTSEISDPTNFPFGKSFIQTMQNNYNSKFQNYAQYSLNKIIQNENPQYSAQGFNNDFSQGGWNAFQAMVQNPANNPIGFQILASQELSRRIGEQSSVANSQLQQSGGFLDMQVCADPRDVTKEQDDAAIAAGVTLKEGTKTIGSTTYTSADPNFVGPVNSGTNSDGTLNYANSTYTTYRRCKKWVSATPGSVIANKLTSTMKDNQNSLVDAQTLNDAVSAILDSLLAKFSAKLTTNGLADFSSTDNWNDTITEDENLTINQETPQTEKDFSDYQREASSWLAQHPDFNIRTDITQAVIDEQRTYIEKLKEQNINIPTLTKGIYQLDYCIPGPHPGWEEDAQKELDKVRDGLNTTIQQTKGIEDTAGYKLLSTFTLGIGTAIIDAVNGAIFKCSGDAGVQIGTTIRNAVAGLTGITNVSKSNDNFCSMNGFDYISSEIMGGYSDLINKYFNVQFLPSIAKEAEQKFYEIPAYEQIVKDNADAIAFQEGVTAKLTTLKKEIDELNKKLTDGTITQETYDNDPINGINPLIQKFAILSTGMVSPNDISQVDSLNKQAIDENHYVVNTLIKTCEDELKATDTSAPSILKNWRIANKVRPAYPKPHLYDYNDPVQPVPAKPDGRFSPSFLGSVVFCENPSETPNWKPRGYQNSNQSNQYDYVLDCINLKKGESSTALNFSGNLWGGSAEYWESQLKIY